METELSDLNLIQTIFYDNEEKVGYRTILLAFLEKYGLIMNPEKVARIMGKYHLICKIRKQKSYGNTFNQQRIENTYNTLLNTTFDCKEPSNVLYTDITYIKYAHGTKTAYLSSATREIVAHTVSNTLEITFVMDSLEQLKELQLNTEAIIHSDQGSH